MAGCQDFLFSGASVEAAALLSPPWASFLCYISEQEACHKGESREAFCNAAEPQSHSIAKHRPLAALRERNARRWK